MGQHVGGARRQDSQRHIRESYAFGDLVDSAVAARRQNQLGAVGDAAPCDGARRARPLRRHQPRVVPRFTQDFGGVGQALQPAIAHLACEGIVNDDGLACGGYGFTPVL